MVEKKKKKTRSTVIPGGQIVSGANLDRKLKPYQMQYV